MHVSDPSADRTLVVVRHARASQDGSSDIERRLEPEGQRAALEAGRWLATLGVSADAALVSAARRAVGTWEALSEGAGWSVAPAVDRALYHADPETALDLIRLVLDDVPTVVVVGHNPTVATLAQLLDAGDGDPTAGAAMAGGGFPAGSVAVFRYAGSWADLAWATADLVAYRPGE